jgi:cellulose synthase/poly-beta-1,6-N-acetylglucosamine synthase-like glycosyltransferase
LLSFAEAWGLDSQKMEQRTIRANQGTRTAATAAPDRADPAPGSTIAHLAARVGLRTSTLADRRLDSRIDSDRHLDAAFHASTAALAPADQDNDVPPDLAVAATGENLPTLETWLHRHPDIADRILLADKTDIRALYLRDPACGISQDAVRRLETMDSALSARRTPSGWQAVAIAAGFVTAGYGLWVDPTVVMLVFAATLSLLFLVGNSINLLACFMPVAQTTTRVPLNTADLPVYTLLVPLYREARIVPQLLASLAALDYPSEKLDIKLLIEADDPDTRTAIENLPHHPAISLVVLPDLGPRTKPKALAVGLMLARGEFVTVFDAEDTPEADQLRQAAESFAANPHLACLQARLSYRNWRESILSRQFAIEYAGHFDVLLPFVSWLGFPVALGGTSNHFRIGALRACGGWDPYNVTEDADLGIRLARLGYRVGVIDSTTFEEAPNRFGAWLAQRTRWMKGWLQTLLVHLRSPVRLFTDLGPWRFFGFHAMVTTSLVSAAVNPFAIGILIWQASGPEFLAGRTGLATVLASIASANLLFGYSAALAKGWVGIWRRPMPGLGLWLLLTPFYWMLTTIALLAAMFDLMIRPHFWAKTEHGLSAQSAPAKLTRRRIRHRKRKRPATAALGA